jgi:hypothetical protein
VLHSAHANKETNKNSHLITQEGSGSLGNFVSLKKGSVKTPHIDDQKHAAEEEA